MDLSFGRRIVSSEATEEEIRHIRTGTLDQVEAIALLRAFDPGAWVRIAFDVTAVAQIYEVNLLLGRCFSRAKPRNSCLLEPFLT